LERSKARSIIGAWVLVSSISNETDGRKLTVAPVVREPTTTTTKRRRKRRQTKKKRVKRNNNNDKID
jgi:hypothetical protein